MSDTRRCAGTNRDESPCSATPLPDRPYCLWHDPDRAADRQRWARQGGKAKSNDARARKQVLEAGRELAEVDARLCLALDDVLAGKIEPGVASAAATLARAIVATRQAGSIEDRIRQLEERAGIGEGMA